jgi:membrane-bound metal-dependent hydrolase YbcI (DUF457 family)
VILFHIGGAFALFRWIYRDASAELAFLALGAVIPDVIDLSIGTLLFADRFGTGELFAHSLLFPAGLGLATLVFTRRGRWRRRLMLIVIGTLMHLLLDGMWTSTETFFWPLAGTDFPAQPSPYWPGAWARAWLDPWRWLKELAGAAYLLALWRRLSHGIAPSGK